MSHDFNTCKDYRRLEGENYNQKHVYTTNTNYFANYTCLYKIAIYYTFCV